jgi:peptidoglycan hydrolase-like protein with peptidoglycan-binding domain
VTTAMCAVALACLGPVAPPAAEAAQPLAAGCQADAELKIGDVGSSVICLQYALGMMGLSDMPITGIYDEMTSNVVSWFQGTHPPLRIDGRAGPQTLAAMGIWSGRSVGVVADPLCKADATIRPGDTSPSARCLQDALRQLGLYNGELTGTSDMATVDALVRYQLDTPPLDADGWAGPRTLAALGIWSGRTGVLSSNGTVVFATTGVPSTGGSGVASTPPNGPWPSAIQPEPLWNVTADGIPFYGDHTACTVQQANVIAFQFAKDGADVATQQWAVYIASREGGCRYDAVNQNAATLDDSHCTYQLNALAGMFAPTAELGRRGWTAESVKLSLDNCADAASDLWVYCGRGPWTPPYSCRPPWKDMAAGLPADGSG